MRRLFVVLLILSACDGGGSANPGDDTPMPDAAPQVDGLPEGWLSLLEGDWNLGPGEEGYFCVYATMPRDVYIKKFRPLTPPGTHHTVLTRYSGATPADSTVRCNVGTNGQSMVYGSGVGAPDFSFPPTVGLHLAKGERLLLNLHLYNATDQPLSGRSGTAPARCSRKRRRARCRTSQSSCSRGRRSGSRCRPGCRRRRAAARCPT
jgi:hypothetical protein